MTDPASDAPPPEATEAETTLELRGLAADNLLAFLALLGLMRALEVAKPEWHPRTSWTGPPWHPWLHVLDTVSEDHVAQVAWDGLSDSEHSFDFAKKLDIDEFSPSEFRDHLTRVAKGATGCDRRKIDCLSALGSDIHWTIKEKKIGDKKVKGPRVEATRLCGMFGSGHQHFLARIEELVGGPLSSNKPEKKKRKKLFENKWTPCKVGETLFRPWQYVDDATEWAVFMRWDPLEDRRYALSYGDPGDRARNPIMTVHGANRLAVEGLSFFPTAPSRFGLQTTGFLRRGRATFLSWPLWGIKLSSTAIGRILSHPELTAVRPARNQLAPYGVTQVMRTRRLQRDKYFNFSPAEPLWG